MIGYLNLTAEFQMKHEAMPWPLKPDDLPPLVRVVFDDPRRLRPALRTLCAADRDIEVLDVDLLRYGFVLYNQSPAREALRLAKIKPLSPYIHWVSKGWAMDMIGKIS